MRPPGRPRGGKGAQPKGGGSGSGVRNAAGAGTCLEKEGGGVDTCERPRKRGAAGAPPSLVPNSPPPLSPPPSPRAPPRVGQNSVLEPLLLPRLEAYALNHDLGDCEAAADYLRCAGEASAGAGPHAVLNLLSGHIPEGICSKRDAKLPPTTI